MTSPIQNKEHKKLKTFLFGLLIFFSGVSIVFSLMVLFSDFIPRRQITPSQAHGIFTTFIEKYIDEANPEKLPAGHHWKVKNLEFKNSNYAIVEATDGQIKTTLEVIYVIEYPKIRVLKINDITNQDLQDASITLIRFLNFLKDQEYMSAAKLYGGPLSNLVPYGTSTAELPVLLEGYCRRVSTLGKCLSFTVSEASRDTRSGLYNFTVHYRLPDNSKFVLGSKEVFRATVEITDTETYLVTSLPFD